MSNAENAVLDGLKEKLKPVYDFLEDLGENATDQLSGFKNSKNIKYLLTMRCGKRQMKWTNKWGRKAADHT